ncbi:MAG: hypothetical protein P8L85_17635 [Rubripirellula sp.]|nr:hypothetical protein [Rubripirellula sp.]
MTLTSEQAFELGQRGAHAMLLKLTTIDLIQQTSPLFENHADQLGLPPRSVPPEESRRLFFEFTCLGSALIGFQARDWMKTDSVFNPKLDPEIHQRFLDGLYEAITSHFDQQQISSLRERCPHGNRNGESLEYREGKPLSGPHMQSRVEEYMKRILHMAERGQTDHTTATDNDFLFHLTELIDARLTNRNEELQDPVHAISQRIAATADQIVRTDLFKAK